MKFEIMNLDWCKRRSPTRDKIKPITVEVPGFEKVDNQRCRMLVTFDDDSILDLNAHIHSTKIHTIGKPSEVIGWSVQGVNEKGISVLVKLIET